MLHKAGRSAFVRQIRERFDAAGTTKPVPAESFRGGAVYARPRWGEALRALYLGQRNVEAYLALTQETGLTAGR